MAYQFPPDLDQFIKDELNRGPCKSEEELVAAALRLLKRDRDEAIVGIQAGIQDVGAGRTQPAEEAFAELNKELGIDE